jgi:hypothetical protein
MYVRTNALILDDGGEGKRGRSSNVKELTRKYVAENMNKPTLEAAARDVVTNKMASFVSQQLGPLTQGVTSIRSNIAGADQAMRQLRDE